MNDFGEKERVLGLSNLCQHHRSGNPFPKQTPVDADRPHGPFITTITVQFSYPDTQRFMAAGATRKLECE